MIGRRGNPNGPTVDGQETEPVHYATGATQVRRPGSIHYKLEPLCRSGAWNMVYSDSAAEVTCKYCKGRM